MTLKKGMQVYVKYGQVYRKALLTYVVEENCVVMYDEPLIAGGEVLSTTTSVMVSRDRVKPICLYEEDY